MAVEPAAVPQSAPTATPGEAAPRRGFRLLRYFSIASGIAILVVSFALSWAYRMEESEEQVGFGEARNVWMAQTFANAITPDFSAHLAKPFVNAETIRADPDTARLHRRLTEMARRVPVIKVKIYNVDGIALYSSVNEEIGEDKHTNPAFRGAREGKTVSELTHRGSMSVSEGRIENVDVVSTYIPIPKPDGRVGAVFEIYTDVTEGLLDVERRSRRLVAGLIIVFAVLYGSLLLIVHRADRILARQYREIAVNEEQIRAKNLELESEVRHRRDIETALRESEKEAAAASRAKTEFLSNMSHELRTPMNAILGFAQLLQSEPGASLGANQARFVEQILKAGRHLLELINEVLDLARIESGRVTLSVEPVPLAAVLAECAPLVQNMARERNIEVNPLPAREQARVMADNMRLKQALLNLLSNAVKYNRPGGRVSIAIARRDGRCRISVIDTGTGIPAARQAEIFRPFSRLGLDAADVEGTGIGLALTKKLIEAMGGTIGFESEWGRGSTFWIELPAAPDAPPQLRPREPVAASLEPALPGRPRTLLYIEDNPANVLLMEQIASRMAMRFLSAHNAEVGIVLAATEKPDIIVMDINLPQMNGYEALARLNANPETASIPVLALSANAMDKDIARGLAAGFVRYETKPVQVDAMIAAISSVVRAHA